MKIIRSYIINFLGVILAAFAIGMFSVPNKIVNGGVSGISTILYYNFKIPAGISYYAINILLLIIGVKKLSKKFIMRTLVSSGLVSLFIDIFSYFPPITEDIILASFFGGVIFGIGMWLTLIEDSSTGGTDILGRIIQNEYPHVQIGKILMLIDLIIITFSFLTFKNTDITLYGIMSLYLSTTTVDLLMHRLNVSKLVFVITQKGESVAEKLIQNSKRGVTMLDAVGAYTMNKKTVLICAMKENELPYFQERVMEIDNEAFIMASESQKIFGKGFYVYH